MPADDQILAGLLQALESSIEVSDRLAEVVRLCIDAQRRGVPIDAATLVHYDSQLGLLAEQRGRLQEGIARWWQLLGQDRPQ